MLDRHEELSNTITTIYEINCEVKGIKQHLIIPEKEQLKLKFSEIEKINAKN